MKAVGVTSFEALADAGPGAYWLADQQPNGERRLYWRCPACGEIGSIVLGGPRGWQLSGTPDAPTVTPSILKTGATCTWHGFLTNGQWVTA